MQVSRLIYTIFAKFPNKTPPSSQIDFCQLPKQKCANSVIGTAKMRQKLKILPNFGMKICRYELFVVSLQRK